MNRELVEIESTYPCFEYTNERKGFVGYDVIYSYKGIKNKIRINGYEILNNEIIKDKIMEVLE